MTEHWMEHDLIQRAQAGDKDAFQHIVETYSDVVWRTARVLLPDRQAAEDAVQEAWLDVWLHLSQYQRGRPFRPWLLTIVTNRSRKAWRRAVLPTLSLTDQESSSVAHIIGDGDVAEDALRSERFMEMQALLARLPHDQKIVLTLHYFAGLALSEIALITEVPLGTVKTRLHRALQAARAHLLREKTLNAREGREA